MAISAEKISITTDKRAAIATPANGKPVQWPREDGEIMDVSMQWKGNALEEVFAAEHGSRVNLFELAPDGGELKMLVTVSSKRLPKPLLYTQVYPCR